MVQLSTRRRLIAHVVLAGFMLAVAGCQSGDGATGLGLGLTGGGQESTQPKISEAELRITCPRVTLREGTSFYRTYAKGGDGDPNKLQYQSSITDVTRACTQGMGGIQMNVAVAGRVIAGPLGTGGTVTMPIRIAVVSGDQILYSQLHKYQVTASATGATQFIFNDPNVIVPDGMSVQVFAGYDEGPEKKN